MYYYWSVLNEHEICTGFETGLLSPRAFPYNFKTTKAVIDLFTFYFLTEVYLEAKRKPDACMCTYNCIDQDVNK